MKAIPSVRSSRRTPTIQVSSLGKFVSSEKEHLHHVDQDDRDHEVRAPAVQGANEPAERDLVIENLQAVPCFSRGRHIEEGEQNAGDQLEHEHRERGAAKDVSPACGLARDRVLHRLPDRRGELQGADRTSRPAS